MPNPRQYYKRTRIAPTPSGYLHLGNILSFAITVALAKQSAAKVLLRIDDLDRIRANKLYLQDIFDTLNFLAIPWDEGPRNVEEFEDSYSQIHRMAMYNKALDQLSDAGLVFACTCSRKQLNDTQACDCRYKQLPLTNPNAAWRLFTNNEISLTVKGYNGQVIHTTLPTEMHNFIVRKKDGFPSYQLASLMDDVFYGGDLIVRGQDLWPSTLAQQALASALGMDSFADITFYHHPLLMETPDKKLSKSAGATSVHYLRENGKTPAGIYALIAEMLGIKETVTNWQQLADFALSLQIRAVG